MKIVKLLDRQGQQVTPQTHIDSVMNSEGQVLDELYAPLGHVGSYGEAEHKVVDETNAGFMSPEMLNHLENAPTNAYVRINSDSVQLPATGADNITLSSGTKITLVPTNGASKSIRFDHNTVDVQISSRTVQSEPEQAFTIEENYTTDSTGHVTARERLVISMPITSRVNELTSSGNIVYLLGSEDNVGNQVVKASKSVSYNPNTQILSAPIIDSNLVGGATGSIPYQLDVNSSTFLAIGTEGQVLKSVSGAPQWSGDKGTKSVSWTNGTEAGPTGNVTALDDTTVQIPAIPSASETQSGVVTTGTQTFQGAKTFLGGITGNVSDLTGGTTGSIPYQANANDTIFLPIGSEGYIITSEGGVPVWKPNKGITSYTWTEGNTSGPVLNTVLADGSTVSTPAVPSATSSTSGVINTGAQVFSGDKTFSNNVTVGGNLTVQGNVYATEQHDLIVSDKRITLSYTDNPSVDTANGSGIEVVTYVNPDETDPAQKYHGPSLDWYSDKGWSTENTDPNTVRSMDINLGSADSVYRINGVQVLSSTQYVGNSATASKVNNALSTLSGQSYDGSQAVTINYDSVGAAIKSHASTSTEFGVASSTEYGHVKVGNGIVVNTGTISLEYGTSASSLASAQSAGTSTSVSRADHVHPFPGLNDCTGILGVSKGGTGVSTLTANGILYGNGTGAVQATAAGTNGQILVSNNGVPTFRSLDISDFPSSDNLPRISDTGLTCDDFA